MNCSMWNREYPLSLLTVFAARLPQGDAFALCRKPSRHHQKPSPWGRWIAAQRQDGRGNSLSQNLTVLPAPSEREPLARPQTLHFSRKLCRYAKGPIPERAVAEGDWGSFTPHKACISTFPPPKVKNPAEKRSRWFKKQFGCVILEAKVPVGRGNRRA